MIIALYANGWDMDVWAERIRRELPDAEVRLPDALGDVSEVDYAMVWKPEPGFLAKLPNLRLICSLGAGVDFLLTDPTLPDVPIVRVIDPDLTARMSEWVVLQCLLHHRRSLAYLEAQSNAVWLNREDAIAGDIRVGILGLGVLGQDAAQKLQMMGYDVAGWSRSPKDIKGLSTYHGTDGLDAMLARTDILVCLLPHTTQTEGILNLTLFGKLAQDGALGGPVVLNAGRGKLQIEADIVTAIGDGTLHGASLDVFESEPLSSDSALWSLPNVILTPHNAASSSARATTAYITRQIRLFDAGEPVESLVDRSMGY